MARRDDRRSDAELLAAPEDGAFRALFDRHARAVVTYLVSRGTPYPVARELMAEAFARAWEHRERFDPPPDGAAVGWLCGIARNVARESARARRVENALLHRLGAVLPPADADVAMTRDDAGRELPVAVEEALRWLPPAQADAVALRVLAELDYAEIAEQHDSSEQAVRHRVSRGLRTIRHRLGMEDAR